MAQRMKKRWITFTMRILIVVLRLRQDVEDLTLSVDQKVKALAWSCPNRTTTTDN